MSENVVVPLPPRNGMYTEFKSHLTEAGERWAEARPLEAVAGTVQAFNEAMKRVTDEAHAQAHPSMQSMAITSGAEVTSSFAHTLVQLARARNISRAGYLSRFVHSDTIEILTWISGLRGSIAKTTEDLVGMRPNRLFDTAEKLAYLRITQRGFGICSKPKLLSDAFRYNPYFDLENGLTSQKCSAGRSGIIKTLVETTANVIDRDPRLLNSAFSL